jgi:hypothetical protein
LAQLGSKKMNRYIFYRITSSVNQKPRLDHFSKLDFLENLLNAFQDYRMICIADNCDEETINFLKTKQFYKFITTQLGNAGSFNYLIQYELSLIDDDAIVYFAEDDYRYTLNASKLLEEGVNHFDYVTLYDHPDKYGTYPYAINPLVPSGKLSERTQILKGTSCVWRTTNSTTMSFGCYAKTIKQDRFIWNFFSNISKVPRDFYIWLILTCSTRNFLSFKPTIALILLFANILSVIKKPRTLGVPIPCAASHMELNMLPDNYDRDFL